MSTFLNLLGMRVEALILGSKRRHVESDLNLADRRLNANSDRSWINVAQNYEKENPALGSR